jgi:O-acetyl-ADP-ribose deacetylase (regulator of RNase III)
MKVKVNKVTISIVKDRLLNLSVTSIVNATDPNLSLTEELAEKGGAALQAQCREIGWCDVGAAVITDAGSLPYQKIIHAVGPRWGEGSERAKLALATLQALRLAEAHRLNSIALPAISTGALGYPLESCAKVMIAQVIDFAFENLKHLRNIVICLADDLAYEAFRHELEQQIQSLKKSGEGKVKV